MIFIQALRKNDINPNGGKQVEFGKAFFETFNWEANTVHEIKIHVGSDVITTSLKVRGSQEVEIVKELIVKNMQMIRASSL